MLIHLILSVLCLLLFTLEVHAASTVPDGWRMQDRFFGLRFEVFGEVQGVGFNKAAVAAAEEIGCFGWVQNSARGTIVGEARCSKQNGPKFVDFLNAGPPGAVIETVETKIYEDTKIKLHFSHFKALEDTRKTCFKDAPHQCPDFAPEETVAEPRWESQQDGASLTQTASHGSDDL
ncbi:unnamed protein product [Chrysoparadoxa australica]